MVNEGAVRERAAGEDLRRRAEAMQTPCVDLGLHVRPHDLRAVRFPAIGPGLHSAHEHDPQDGVPGHLGDGRRRHDRGGIFSVLGVVIGIAGSLSWLAFLVAGCLALLTGLSYERLARRFGEGGGAFTFLREVHREGAAGSLSWVLLLGYVLTLSVYAFTFGHYLNAMLGLGPWFPRASAVAMVLFLVAVNLRGVGDASWLELLTVYGKLLVLAAVAAYGLVHYAPEQLTFAGAEPGGLSGALLGAATIFMAYEGFQLLTYDYDDIEDPARTLPRAITASILSVIVVYVAVAIGAASLVGADRLVAESEIALAAAGQAAFGTPGLILIGIAAAFSTASAVNATLFATARLARDIARDEELPGWLRHENGRGVPDRAVMALGACGVALATLGGLGELVEAASLAFLFTFCVVNVLSARVGDGPRWTAWLGAAGTAAAAVALIVRLVDRAPIPLAVFGFFVLVAMFGRPWILRATRRSG